MKKIFAFIAAICLTQFVDAQSGRFGIEGRFNFPVGLTSIPANLGITNRATPGSVVKGNEIAHLKNSFGESTVSYGFAASYRVSALVTAGISYNSGRIQGYQMVCKPSRSNRPNNYKFYINEFNSYECNLQLDVMNVFSRHKREHRITPTVMAGFGFVTSNIMTIRADGRIRDFHYSCYSSVVGTQANIRVAGSTYVNIGTTLYLTDTYYLDGIPNDNKKDKLLIPYLGIMKRI